MRTLTAHEFAQQQNSSSRSFEEFNTDFVVELLAEVYSRFPHARELIFHGHELREPRTLRVMGELQQLLSPYTMGKYGSSQPDQWMSIDLFACSAEQIAEIMRPYETGMLYVPAEGASSVKLGNLIIQQTSGLGSLFQPKTYKHFLGMDVFVAVTGKFYQVRSFQH